MDGEIDMAVHSMKDMPSVLPEGLVSGAVPARKDPRDCLISKEGTTLDDLPTGAKVGTSSLRRSSQLKAYRPDLQIEWIRGISILAFAKWRTVNFRPSFWRPPVFSVWAGRTGSRRTCRLKLACQPSVRAHLELNAAKTMLICCICSLYNDEVTARTVAAERKFLSELNGGCQVPIGAYAVLKNVDAGDSRGEQNVIQLTGMVGSPDGEIILKESAEGTDPESLGVEVAEKLKAKGAEKILAQVRG